MQAVLILRTIKIVASEAGNRTIIPPDEKADDYVKDVRYDDMRPTGGSPNTQGRETNEDVSGIQRSIFRVLNEVEWDIDSQPNDGENHHKVARHLGESQEKGSVDSDLLGEDLFACFYHR